MRRMLTRYRTGGYKWLKYVPNGILKTAQAAEWKVQAWMIGKPPTLAYEGIGYTATPPTSPRRAKAGPRQRISLVRAHTTGDEAPGRPSIDSNFESEYDDLRDFDGRFSSRSTLGAGSLHGRGSVGAEKQRAVSRGFLRRLKSGSRAGAALQPVSAPSSPVVATKKLKGLRSMGSLKGSAAKGKGTPVANAFARREVVSSPQLPQPLVPEAGLGLGDDWVASVHGDGARPISSATTNSSSNTSGTLDWTHRGTVTPSTPPPVMPRHKTASMSDRSSNAASTTRSLSFSLPHTSPSTVPTSPMHSTYHSPYAKSLAPSNTSSPAGTSYQATLGNALIAASHAESAKGTHSDFLQILNHDNRPLGFQYPNYPHKVRVWYGDKDEKIAENAVRWMERNMGEDKCQVKVVKGADHALMYKSAVVIEVLERIREHARAGEWHRSCEERCTR